MLGSYVSGANEALSAAGAMGQTHREYSRFFVAP